MKHEFTLTLDGVEYPVIADGATITVNGRAFAVEVNDEGAVLVDGIAYDAALDGERVTVGGQAHTLRVSGLAISAAHPVPVAGRAAPKAAAATSAGAVLAIMPGKIVRIMVDIGQQVEEGQPVCVLEAMKMENELQARQAGAVASIHVRPGEDVEKGAVLIEIT